MIWRPVVAAALPFEVFDWRGYAVWRRVGDLVDADANGLPWHGHYLWGVKESSRHLITILCGEFAIEFRLVSVYGKSGGRLARYVNNVAVMKEPGGHMASISRLELIVEMANRLLPLSGTLEFPVCVLLCRQMIQVRRRLCTW